jgi:hypothetical protein
MHLMRCLLRVSGEAMMSLMSGVLGMHGHASEAESHGARDDARAPRTGRRVWSRETHGDTRALPYRVTGPAARGDSKALMHREAGLEPWDT